MHGAIREGYLASSCSARLQPTECSSALSLIYLAQHLIDGSSPPSEIEESGTPQPDVLVAPAGTLRDANP